MTLKEAYAQGYRDADVTFFRGYVSRKTNPDDAVVKTAGGNRKGQLYVELPCWESTQYAYRQYLTK